MLKYIQYITEAKASPMSTFIAAAKNGSHSKIKELIKYQIDINVKDSDGRTALMLACDGNYLMIVITLLNAGANVEEKDRFGSTALYFARTSKIVDKLLDAGADVNSRDTTGETPAMSILAPQRLNIETLEKYLKKGLDLKIENNDGYTLYDLIERQIEWIEDRKNFGVGLNYYKELEKFIEDRFPNSKEEYEMKKYMKKYNI